MNNRERNIFLEALEIATPEERRTYVEQACAEDGRLRERVLGLLAAHQDAGSFLPGADRPREVSVAPASEGVSSAAQGPGTLVGRYKLLEKIGEGGFGVVFMAEQREPVKRRVALKIIKLGMDTEQVVARFEAERQALAMMEHPNIARVLDAGATDTGRPYFVMELVRGVPITQFCDEYQLSPSERLRLFVSVCEAIQHAHQKGIIHRDIKPNNVLITLHDDRAVPKVIDFGIAKAMSHELTDKTVFTRFHEFLGTPAYMSPEQTQLSGLDIDTRSDIYSLGVLLYELLTGRTPFDAKELLSASYDEIRRRIREEEPLKPSTRLNSLATEDRARIARLRKSDPHRLRRALKGELDWIVMKAMEKDRSRRYESASALAQDIGHYLRDEPVTAVAPRVGYRMRKFAKRHRAALGAAAALATVLIVATLVSVGMAVRATTAERTARLLLENEQRARQELERTLVALRKTREVAESESARARAEAATSSAVVRFVGEDLFGSADPENEPDRDLTLREVLDRASRLLQGSLADQPLVAASLHATLGRAYRNLGLFGEAIDHSRSAYQLHLQTSGERHETTLRALISFADALNAGNQRHEAIALISKARELVRDTLGPQHPLNVKCAAQLAWMRYRNKERAEAFRLAEEAYEAAGDNPAVDDVDLFTAMHLVARKRGASRTGNFQEGEAMLRQLVQLARDRRGEDHLLTVRAKHHLAVYCYDSQRNLDEAERLYGEVLQTQRRVLGESHSHTQVTRENLALLYDVLRRPAEALLQRLTILQFNPLAIRTLDRMPRQLGAPPLEPLPGLAVDTGWRMTTNPPSARWTEVDFTETQWQPMLQPNATEAWFRRELDLPIQPEQPLVFWVGSWGNFEVFLNGIRVVEKFASVRGEYQLAVSNTNAETALRPGRNVLALHATHLRPPEEVRFALYHLPRGTK